MTTQLDFSVSIAKETTYGQVATPTRAIESEAKFKYDIQKVQGKGMRPSKRVQRGKRSSLARLVASGDTPFEIPTSGFGLFLNAVLGVVTNTVVPTLTPTRYQQVHTLTKTDPIDSYTIQEIIPLIGGAAGQPHTFTGCVADSIDIEAKEGEIVTAKISWLGKGMNTATPAAAAVYPGGNADGVFTFVHGTIGLSGTLTPPTATVLGSLSGSPAANISDISVSIKNNLDTGGYNLGGAGSRSRKNVLGVGAITGKLTAEYDSNTLRDAYLNQTFLPLVLTFLHDDGVSVLQIILPAILLKGEVPTTNGGAPATQSIDFEAYDNDVAAESIYVVIRTVDTTV